MEINTIINKDCVEGMREMPDDFVDYVLTSPPYNQSSSGADDMYVMYTDNMENNEYIAFLSAVIDEMLRVTKHQIFFNIQYTAKNCYCVFTIIGKYADKIKDILIWEKPFGMPPSKNTLLHNYEFIIVFDKNNLNRSYDKVFENRTDCTTCFFEKNNSFTNKERFGSDIHHAIMPINLAKRIITQFTNKGDIILDPFMGVGTTAVACKISGRNYIGFDLVAEYIKIAEERISKVTSNIFW